MMMNPGLRVPRLRWCRSRGAEHAAGEGLVADEGVDDATAERAEDAGRLGPAGRDADDVGDLEQVLEADAEDPVVDDAADGGAVGGVVAGGDVPDRLRPQNSRAVGRPRLSDSRIADEEPWVGVPMPTKAMSARPASSRASAIDGSASRASREVTLSRVAGAWRKRYSAPRRTASSRTSSWPLISLLIEDSPPTSCTSVRRWCSCSAVVA